MKMLGNPPEINEDFIKQLLRDVRDDADDKVESSVNQPFTISHELMTEILQSWLNMVDRYENPW